MPNPLFFPANYDNIFTSLPLVADGDSEGGGGWLSKVFSSYNDLHWGWKIGVGAGLFLSGLGLTLATAGTALPFIANFGIGVAVGTAIGTGINLAKGESFGDALLGGFADSVLLSGAFSFGSGAIRAGKYGYAYATKNAEIMAKLFTHNKHAASVMLGKWDKGRPTGYIAQAKAGGHKYFAMSPRIYKSLSTRMSVWEVNKAFLAQQLGKTFVTSHSTIGAIGIFADEIAYLLLNRVVL